MRNVSISIDLYDYPLHDLTLKQYDVTTLKMHIYEHKELYNLDGLTVTLAAVMPNNTAALMQENVKITLPNTVTVKLAEEVTETPGEVQFELVILRGSEQISTYNFVGVVERASLGCHTHIVHEDVSCNIYRALAKAAQAIETLRVQLEEATEISENMEEYLKTIRTALSEAIEDLKKQIEEIAEDVKEKAETAIDEIKQLKDDVTELEKSAGKSATDSAESATKSANSAQASAGSASAASSSASLADNSAKDAKKYYDDTVKVVDDKIKAAIYDAWEGEY